MLPEIRFGARAHMLPVDPKKIQNLKTHQKNLKKIMHVPDHGTHHRICFRAEIFLSKFVIFVQGAYDVISARKKHGGAYHGQVRA